MRPSLLACLSAALVACGPLTAADQPAPPKPATPPASTAAAPAEPAPAVDPVTARRAGAAADAILQREADAKLRPDPEAENTLAEAEVLLLTAQTYLDQKQPLKAGETFVAASAKLQGIPVEQRKALGKRLVAANGKLTGLSRLLLEEPKLDPGQAGPTTPPAASVPPTPAKP